MRKIFFILLFCSALPFVTKAQIEELKEGTKGSPSSGKVRTVLKPQPLVVVDGTVTDFTSLLVSPNSIQEVNVLKDSTAVVLYGAAAKDGAVIIKTKPGTEFKTLTDFVNPAKNLNPNVTSVQLNGATLPDMKRLLIEKTAVVKTAASVETALDKTGKAISVNTLLITALHPEDKK